MVRFRRSTNEVFSWEESSESRNACSNRQSPPITGSALHLHHAIVSACLDDLAVETRGPKDSPDDSFVERESVRDNQRNTVPDSSGWKHLETGPACCGSFVSRPPWRSKAETRPRLREDPDRLLLAPDDRSYLVCLKLYVTASPVVLRSLKRRQETGGPFQPAMDRIPGDSLHSSDR